MGLLNVNDKLRPVSVGAEQAGTHLLPLRKSEINLLEMIRHMGYGELTGITVKAGQPIFVTCERREIKLD